MQHLSKRLFESGRIKLAYRILEWQKVIRLIVCLWFQLSNKFSYAYNWNIYLLSHLSILHSFGNSPSIKHLLNICFNSGYCDYSSYIVHFSFHFQIYLQLVFVCLLFRKLVNLLYLNSSENILPFCTGSIFTLAWCSVGSYNFFHASTYIYIFFANIDFLRFIYFSLLWLIVLMYILGLTTWWSNPEVAHL